MKKAYISELAYPEIKAWLTGKGYELCELPVGEKPYPAVSSHPDLYMTNANGRLIMAEKGTIRGPFPAYLGYNCVFLDRFFIHNLRYTAPEPLGEAERLGLRKLHVNQGYTKCSCVVVDGSAVITSDEGIYSALRDAEGIDVLKVRPGYVTLPGFEYGFLGGASGRAGNTVLFNGGLDTHPDGDEVRRFILDRGLEVFEVRGRELADIGTIFT
jgi:hypothetical protein